jgi:hypothetical protein
MDPGFQMLLASIVGAALVLGAPGGFPDPDIVTDVLQDFDRQGAPPAEFRNVRLGLYTYRPGDRRPILCGQFRPDGVDSAWEQFVSLDTHGYEHWLGLSATALCQREDVALEGADWAARMNEQLRARDRSEP